MYFDRRIGFVICWLAVGLALLPARHAASSRADVNVPFGFVDEGVVSGLKNPTSFAFPPDGRILVIEQAGDFKVFQADGTLLATTPIDVNFPTASYTERGLLGMDIDPNFDTNHIVYLYYTRIPAGQPPTSTDPTVNRLSRFTLSGNQVVTTSEVALLDDVPALTYTHHGGDVHYGFDGKLWLSTGDSGTASNAPLLSSLNGKILRLNPSGSAPIDNPFYAGLGQPRDFVWAKGFRNPWRFALNPQTRAPFIGDVGQDTWEELDIGYAGADYGWPAYEGTGVYLGPSSYSFVEPLLSYNHSIGCTGIIGGDFVYDSAWPAEYQFNYFFTDLGCGTIWRVVLDPDNPNSALSISPWGMGLSVPVALKHGRDGQLYYLSFPNGELRRIRWTLTNSIFLPIIYN